MAWIESHQSLAGHPKTKKFARKLGVSIPAAIGHLHMLWWWALDYAQDGNISRHDPEDIADAMGWSGDPDDLFDALLTAGANRPGWIERRDDAYYLHDWHQYGGKFIKERADDAERKRNARKKRTSGGNQTDVQETSGGHPVDVGGTVHNSTVHTVQTIQNNTNQPARVVDDVVLPQPSFSRPEPKFDRENVFGIYQRCIGQTTDYIRERLASLELDYGEEWTIKAIEEAALQNVPRMKYIESTLRGWQTTGHPEPWTIEKPRRQGKGASATSEKPRIPIVSDMPPDEPMTKEEQEEMWRIVRKLDNNARAPNEREGVTPDG